MKQTLKTLLVLGIFALLSCKGREDSVETNYTKYTVPISGNSFITSKTDKATGLIGDNQLREWTNPNTIISTYFRVSKSGKLNIGIKASVSPENNSSVIKVSINGIEKKVNLSSTEPKEYDAGEFYISTPGYVKVDLQGIEKTGNYFADVTDITFSGEAATGENIFTKDKEFYGHTRRGPSCFFHYDLPQNEDIEYFYNEVFVPDGKDIVGSYFMVDGCSEGYFGMQVNSDTERRMLFSVWSPKDGNDANKVPEDKKVLLNRKGTDVIINEFEGEGTGGQSYLKYNWKAGKIYKFLLRGKPDGTGKTDYTAWFQSPDENNWILIASWKRPETNTYLKGLYSFIESLSTSTGYQGRKAEYRNQWVMTASGKWISINQATFNVDATYYKGHRVDAKGGVIENGFFLQNGGFFNDSVELGTKFSTTAGTNSPNVDFSNLP